MPALSDELLYVRRRGSYPFGTFGSFVAAPSYYVSPTGSNGNSGTSITEPWQTINFARSVMVAGETVYIRGGTYNEELSWAGGNRGTSWSAPIMFAAYPSETVIISPNSGASRPLTLSNSGTAIDDGPEYLIFQGLTFDAVNCLFDCVKITEWDAQITSSGYTTYGARHLKFLNCIATVIGTETRERQGYLIGGHDVSIIGGRVHHLGLNTPQTGNSQGIYGAASDLLVDGVEIDNIQGYGMSNVNSTPGVDSHNHTIRNNRVHHNLKGGINEGEGTGHSIVNNVCWENDAAIQINSFGAAATTPGGVVIAFNTCTQNNVGFEIGNFSSNPNCTVRNNISWANGTDYFNDEGTTIADHNLFGTNPLFVNAGAENFHLQSGSPAINAGVAVSGITTDADGVTRGDPPEIGAYEF